MIDELINKMDEDAYQKGGKIANADAEKCCQLLHTVVLT